jgi:putative endonuclease
MSSLRSWFFRLFQRHRPTGPAHLRAGAWGEDLAERFIIRKGYTIIGRNVRVGKKDEIDCIARAPDGVLVFVEVKTRVNELFGRPFSAVDKRKRKTLSRAALRYMMRLKSKPDYFRMDVIEVIGTPEQKNPVVRHIENAFQLSGNKRIPW